MLSWREKKQSPDENLVEGLHNASLYDPETDRMAGTAGCSSSGDSEANSGEYRYVSGVMYFEVIICDF